DVRSAPGRWAVRGASTLPAARTATLAVGAGSATLRRDGESVIPVAWYRFRTTFRRAWPAHLVTILLVGTIGGLAMRPIPAARRTQSSYPALLAASNASDLGFTVGVFDPATGAGGYDPEAIAEIRHLPHVKHVETWAALNVAVLKADGDLDQRVKPQAGAGS